MVLTSTSTNKLQKPLATRMLSRLSSSPVDDDGRTHFVLFAWRAFTRPTVAEDRDRYCGPKGDPDVRLECEWDAGDPEVERSALLRACAGIPGAELITRAQHAAERYRVVRG
jgi:hypothetical protein